MVSVYASIALSSFPLSSRNARSPCHLSFQAPELFDQLSKANTASDMWSVGCVVWEILTGDAPYTNSMQQHQVIKYVDLW